jgi:cholesterol transport system auxiliary component
MRWATAAVAAVLASGCLGGLTETIPQPLIYRIDAPTLAAGAPLAADLRIDVGPAAPGLEGPGIATRWPGQRLDYIAGARWAEELPRLLEAALVEAFAGSARLHSVQGDFGRFRATHTLVVEVRRFEADYTGGAEPVAKVALYATIGRASDRQVLATFTAVASESAAGNRQAAIVAALDAAFARATAEMAGRVFDAIAADGAAQASANIRP